MALKVARSTASRRLKKPASPAVFESAGGGGGRQQKEKDELRLSYSVPNIQWVSNPHSARLREACTFFKCCISPRPLTSGYLSKLDFYSWAKT